MSILTSVGAELLRRLAKDGRWGRFVIYIADFVIFNGASSKLVFQ